MSLKKKKIIGGVMALCVLFGIVVAFLLKSSDPFADFKHVSKVQVQIAGKVIDAWYSDTETLRAQGLSDLPGLPENGGMFFAFEKNDFHGFWMRNMLFPIDIIWIGEDFKVVHIEKNVSPDSYPTIFFPKRLARSVLEVSAGFTDKTGLKIGAPIRVLKQNQN